MNKGRSEKVVGHFSCMARNWGIDEIRPIDRCIFIAGVPRSGTTASYKILMEALSGKSDVAATARTPDVTPESFYFESEANPSNEEFQRAKIAFLGGNTKYVDMFNHIDLTCHRQHLEITPTDTSRIYFDLVRQYYELSIPCEKTPSNILFARRIFQTSRHALLLFLVRHPASVLGSMRRRASVTADNSQWLNKGFKEFCWFYKFYIDKYYEMKLRYGSRVQLLRYEDLYVERGLLVETIQGILGPEIFRGVATSRLDRGQSDSEIRWNGLEDYYGIQEQILHDTLEYLEYGPSPPKL